MACQRRVKWDHYKGIWGLNILAIEEVLKISSKPLCCRTDWGTGWPQKAPKDSWVLLQQVEQLGVGSMGCTATGLVKISLSSLSWGSIAAMLLGDSPGSALGYPAGIIKLGRVVLTILVGVVGV